MSSGTETKSVTASEDTMEETKTKEASTTTGETKETRNGQAPWAVKGMKNIGYKMLGPGVVGCLVSMCVCVPPNDSLYWTMAAVISLVIGACGLKHWDPVLVAMSLPTFEWILLTALTMMVKWSLAVVEKGKLRDWLLLGLSVGWFIVWFPTTASQFLAFTYTAGIMPVYTRIPKEAQDDLAGEKKGKDEDEKGNPVTADKTEETMATTEKEVTASNGSYTAEQRKIMRKIGYQTMMEGLAGSLIGIAVCLNFPSATASGVLYCLIAFAVTFISGLIGLKYSNPFLIATALPACVSLIGIAVCLNFPSATASGVLYCLIAFAVTFISGLIDLKYSNPFLIATALPACVSLIGIAVCLNFPSATASGVLYCLIAFAVTFISGLIDLKYSNPFLIATALPACVSLIGIAVCLNFPSATASGVLYCLIAFAVTFISGLIDLKYSNPFLIATALPACVSLIGIAVCLNFPSATASGVLYCLIAFAVTFISGLIDLKYSNPFLIATALPACVSLIGIAVCLNFPSATASGVLYCLIAFAVTFISGLIDLKYSNPFLIATALPACVSLIGIAVCLNFPSATASGVLYCLIAFAVTFISGLIGLKYSNPFLIATALPACVSLIGIAVCLNFPSATASGVLYCLIAFAVTFISGLIGLKYSNPFLIATALPACVSLIGIAVCLNFPSATASGVLYCLIAFAVTCISGLIGLKYSNPFLIRLPSQLA